ncbi:hypothetical protein AX774_g1711 [Zancudomyces culisetae]|uniref:Uncharacterized protein n=1 Tax=Zancudomyces culisetae TaxID=1213189 RepID=A0A1R1PV14_ZANCU|nr:hypothetical protein AX774_g1711 [Zancudomyces culisetae]|eukprot:OMH84759.1 hypothetical protein AX774_g1711 [Zancudomyces culisetae]
MNRAAKVIPSLLLNAAITECDINPWFVMNSSVSVERICCILTDPTHKFKVLSLEQYMDYPMTTLSSDEDENFFKTMSYFGVVMSNNHKESSHINHSQNYQNILKFDTDFNTPPFNDCEPSLPGKIYTPYMPSRIFGFPSRTNFSVHKFVNTLLPLILSISGSDNYTDE